MQWSSGCFHAKGFTLIELLLLLAIAGLLVTLSLPSYRVFMDRAYQRDAQSALLSAAQLMEHFYWQHGRYDQDNLGNANQYEGQTEAYQIIIDSSQLSQHQYRLMAQPKPGFSSLRFYAIDNRGFQESSQSDSTSMVVGWD